MQLLHVGVALPRVEVVEPLNRAIQCLCVQAWQAVVEDKGAAARRGSEDAKSVPGLLSAVVLPGPNAQIRGRNTFACESFVEVLLEQLSGREHQPTVHVGDTWGFTYRLDQPLFAFFQERGVELLAQTTDQGRGFASTRRPQNQQAFVEGKT